VPADPASTTATEFPQLARTERNFFEGGLGLKSTAVVQEYDDLGNVSRYSDTGDVAATDDVTAVISYASCPASYIVGKANRIVISGSGAVMRNREATIDCTTGVETQIRQFLETGQVAITDLAYTGSGNILSVTGATNRNGQRYQLKYQYDLTVDTFVTN